MPEDITKLNEEIKRLKEELSVCQKMSEALAESEQKWLSVFHSARDGIVVLDMTGKVLDVNKSMLDIGGFSEEEIVGKRLTALKMFPPSSIAKMVTNFAKRMAGKEVPLYEVEVRAKDGRKIIAEILAARLRINGKVVGEVSILRDATTRKEIENALKKSEERLQVIFDSAPDAYYLNDLQGNFIGGNKAAERLIGYKKEELIGKNMLKAKLLPIAQIPIAAKLLAQNVLGKTTGPDELTLIRKDGTLVIAELRTSLVEVNGQKLVLGIARDVTERRKMEIDLHQKNKELEKFNKLSVGREMRMVELKDRVRELEEELKKQRLKTG